MSNASKCAWIEDSGKTVTDACSLLFSTALC